MRRFERLYTVAFVLMIGAVALAFVELIIPCLCLLVVGCVFGVMGIQQEFKDL